MIRTILAVVEGGTDGGAFTEVTLAFAKLHDAHVVFDILAPLPLTDAEMPPYGALLAMTSNLQQIENDAGAKLRARLPVDQSVECLTQLDDVRVLHADLRRSAPVADLITVGPVEGWTVPALRRRAIETLLLESGTPLLLVSEGKAIRAVERAVIGWKPGASATRALHALAGLAEPGARVDVVHVADGAFDRSDAALEHVTRFLNRHGLIAEAHPLRREGRVADRLRDFALDRGADLLVVGGYAHSRAREIIFGGVTRSVVESAPVPILMAH